MVPPPGGPEVIAVLENRFRNGLAQDIILGNSSSTSGQNAIYVRAFGPMGRERGRERLDDEMPTPRVIRRELRERLPQVHMEISGLYAQNRYGPLSYATGRTRSGINCVYVWQRIAADGAVFAASRGSINWRMRLCDRHTTTRDLLLTAFGTTITGYFLSRRWNPYGELPEVDPRVGQLGETVLPQAVVDPTVIAPNSFAASNRKTVRTPRRRRSRSVSRSTVATQQRTVAPPTVLNQPVEGAAVVPRPENTSLREPQIQDSNLPSRAQRTGPGFRVPAPLGTAPGAPGQPARQFSQDLLAPSPSANFATPSVPLPAPAGRVVDR
ncbi:MAG: cellulose biosynthesis protein BcsN [Pseudomonadota bacterium]